MKKHIIFSFVGGLILWLWQFISFAAANLHGSAAEFTPKSQEIIAAIEASGIEEGRYLLGQIDPALIAAGEATGFETAGKPWAILHWDRSMESNMGMNMFRGVMVCVLVAALLFSLIQGFSDPTVKKGAGVGLLVGFMAFLAIPYTNYIWYESPDIWAYALDAVIPWVGMGSLAGRMAQSQMANA